MKRSGYTDLPLHGGRVPPWLYERMTRLGGLIVEAILLEYGKKEFVKRMSDPLWFQSLGCLLGMDWHSSGITTSVMGALKNAINPRSDDLGIYICGGRGKHSRKTPVELKLVADKTGLDGDGLVRASKLSAKVDNTAIQDGFQLYLHSFILDSDGHWTVVQQGMNPVTSYARRYHWHSADFSSFTNNPHSAICGIQRTDKIINLVDSKAKPARNSILALSQLKADKVMHEARSILMPAHHDVRAADVNLKRLGSVLALAQDTNVQSFSSLLLTPGLGPRTLQSLALVSEVVYGHPSRFEDPARFSFAHGGKDGHPFPVPLKVYDQSIHVLKTAVDKSKMGFHDKKNALQKLHGMVLDIEKGFVPNQNFDKVVAVERTNSYKYEGMTVFGPAKASSSPKDRMKRDQRTRLFEKQPPQADRGKSHRSIQLSLF